MATIIINGIRYDVEGSGNSVSVIKDSVVVNGTVIATGLPKEIHVHWEGPLASLDCTSCTINGDVKGDVDCTSINCGSVGGNVDATQVHCGSVTGKVSAVQVNRR